MKTLAIIGFLFLSVLCIYFRAGHVETDLSLRSRESLQNANLQLPALEFDGRDALLSGIVESEVVKEKIGKVISEVYGVRAIHNNLLIKKEQQPVIQDSMLDKLQITLNTLVLNQGIEFATGTAVLTPSSTDIVRNSSIDKKRFDKWDRNYRPY